MILILLALSAQAVDLEGARERAAQHASAVEIARAQADAANADANAVRGGALPALSGFANITVGDGYTSIGFERPVPWQTGLGVTGSWSLVNPAQWTAATAARRTARGRVAMLNWTRAQARQQVTVAYAQALAASTTAGALAAAAEDAERAKKAVDTLVNAGIRPPADSSRALADALDLAALAAGARGEVAVTCAQLQALLDVPIDGHCEVDAVDWSSMQPAAGPSTHPALEAFDEAVGAARASNQSTMWEHLPTLDASGTAATYSVPERTGPGWSATVGVTVPLTFATTGAAETRSARAELERATADLDRQQRDLSVATVQADARLDAARQVYRARAAGLEASQQAWNRVDGRFREGLEDLTTWLAARRVRIDAQVARANAEASLASSLAAVEAARGVN